MNSKKKRRAQRAWEGPDDRGESAFRGLDSIPALLAFCVVRGSSRLRADDIAALNRIQPGATAELGWVSVSVLEKLDAVIDEWADRGIRDRYKLRARERAALVECLGDKVWNDGRALVLVAAHLGRAFSAFAEDFDEVSVFHLARSAGVLPTPRSFLAEASNLPPSLGQMGSISAVRRWCGAFWFADALHVRALGPMPEPRRVRVPELVRATLECAVEDQVMRIAAVTWRRHERDELARHESRPGTFAVKRITRACQAGGTARLALVLAEQRVHLAVLPELMLDDDEFQSLQAELARLGRRFPGLIVVGRAHRLTADGARFANLAAALDSGGRLLFEHEKLEPYPDRDLGIENIVPRESNHYHFADTPLGRLVLNVCRDIRSDVPMLLNRVLGASVVAVPAYSKNLDFVAEEARVLGARQSAIVVAANPLSPDLVSAAQMYAPIRGRSKSEAALSFSRADALAGTADALVQVWEIRLGPGRTASLEARHHEAV